MAQQAVAPRMEAEGAKEEEVGMEVVVEGAAEEEEEEEEDGVEEVGVEVPLVEVEDPQLLILARWSTCLIQMMVWRSSLNSDFL